MSWSFAWQGRAKRVAELVGEASTQYLVEPEKTQVENIKALVKAELQRVSPTSWVKVDASGSAVVTRTVEQSQQNVPGDMQSFNFKLEVTPLWNLVE